MGSPKTRRSRSSLFATIAVIGVLALPGCSEVAGPGQGPGRRAQNLALSPEEELQLGRQAYQKILAEGRPLPQDSDEVRRVKRVGQRIARASEIGPLQREINLHFEPSLMEWEFNVLDDPHINAFCLPGGKVVVFSGLLPVAEDDDALATVLGHEIAHALAHHASERAASSGLTGLARQGLDGRMNAMDTADKARIVAILAGLGLKLYGLSGERRQESEADHIGLFLMTFAGYNPEKAVDFWDRMSAESARRGTPPEILSDHPSDARRIGQIQAWAPQAEGAKRAYDEGRVAPGDQE